MSNVNKVILIGRLGKDPESIQFDNGKKVNFSLATSEYYYDKEGKKREMTEWHNVVIWRENLIDVAEKYLKKGDLLYVEGRIRSRSWDDKETNQKRYITEIVVDAMQMLGSPKNKNENVSITQEIDNGSSDDLPF